MPVLIDFSLVKGEDAVLNVAMAPPVPVGGWDVRFSVARRYDSESGFVTRSVASGYNGVSGITVADSGQGVFSVRAYASDFSGRDPGNYAYSLTRWNSGNATSLTEGFVMVGPRVGG